MTIRRSSPRSARPLSETGDILLYGCNVAQGEAGARFIEQLSAYTGAEVAASTDYTGALALGGDWVLEASTGAIEAEALSVGAEGFDGLLAAPLLTGGGTLDTTFDGDGKVNFDFFSSEDIIRSVALQPDGKIVVAGNISDKGNPPNSYSLARYNADGSLDTTFNIEAGGNGGYSVALQPDGKIVVAGIGFNGTDFDFALARYNNDGSFDTSFDFDGKVTTDIATGGGSHDEANDVVQKRQRGRTNATR